MEGHHGNHDDLRRLLHAGRLPPLRKSILIDSQLKNFRNFQFIGNCSEPIFATFYFLLSYVVIKIKQCVKHDVFGWEPKKASFWYWWSPGWQQMRKNEAAQVNF